MNSISLSNNNGRVKCEEFSSTRLEFFAPGIATETAGWLKTYRKAICVRLRFDRISERNFSTLFKLIFKPIFFWPIFS